MLYERMKFICFRAHTRQRSREKGKLCVEMQNLWTSNAVWNIWRWWWEFMCADAAIVWAFVYMQYQHIERSTNEWMNEERREICALKCDFDETCWWSRRFGSGGKSSRLDSRKVNCLHKTKTLSSSSFEHLLKQLWETHFIFIYLLSLLPLKYWIVHVWGMLMFENSSCEISRKIFMEILWEFGKEMV